MIWASDCSMAETTTMGWWGGNLLDLSVCTLDVIYWSNNASITLLFANSGEAVIPKLNTELMDYLKISNIYNIDMEK